MFSLSCYIFHSYRRAGIQNSMSWGLYLRRADDVKTNWKELSANDIARIARNVQAAFGIFHDRYLTRIYQYPHRRLNDRSEAEDVTSAIFIRACERIGNFRGGSFPAWLFANARTTVIDTYRVNRCVQSTPLEDDVVSSIDPAMTEVDEDRVTTVSDLIRSLTAEQQKVIELRLSGLGINETASSIGKSVPATEKLQLCAMKRLK